MKNIKLNNLFNDYAKGNLESRDKILEHFKSNIEEVAESFYNLGFSKDEVLNLAYEGFYLYLEKYIKTNSSSKNFYNYYKKRIYLYLNYKINGGNIKLSENDRLEILFNKYRSGDLTARDRIFEKYLKAALNEAKDFFDLGVDNEDIIGYTHEILLETILYYRDISDSQKFARDWKKHLRHKLINFIKIELDLPCKLKNKQDLIKLLKTKRDLIKESKILGNSIENNVLEIGGIESLIMLPMIGELRSEIVDPEVSYIYRELQNEIFDEITSSLKATYKRIFYLLFFKNYHQREIGDLYGISKAAISMKKKTIIKKIKERNLQYLIDLSESKDSLEEEYCKLLAKIK